MININKVYIKKDNKKVEIIPIDVEDGYVHYHHVGWLDWRKRPIKEFYKVYELKIMSTNDNVDPY